LNPTPFSASALIPAPAPELYAILADYQEGHPRILPRPPFVDLHVEKGGIGDGTVIRVGMRILGRERVFRALVTEPEPGKVLRETNDDGYETTFTVAPRNDGHHTLVTISTVASQGRRWGLRGFFEGWLVRRLLTPVYRRELELLAKVATERNGRRHPEGTR
jgi:hypothetical protein